jgi:DnaJ like chaperone protein
VLAVAVIHADGRVQRSEAQSLLHFSQTAGLQGVDWTAALLRPTPALLGPAVEGTRLRWPDWGPRTLLERLTGLCGAGAGEPERRVLLEIGGWLGAPAAAVDHVFAGRSGSSEVEIRRACEILGLPSTASAEEARAAWRARVAAHHPDRVARRGEVAVAEATRQVQAYNAAWQVLATALSDSIVAPPRAVEVPNNPPPANAPWDRVLKTLGTWVFGTGGR